MDKRLITILALCGSCTLAWAQTVMEPDSLTETGLSKEDIEELMRPANTSEHPLQQESLSGESILLRPESDLKELLAPPSYNELPPSLVVRKEEILEKYPLPMWEQGYIYGSSYTQSSMLYGSMAAANAGIRHRFSRQLTAQAEVGLQKYSVFYNTATANAQMVWQPSPYFAITAFGAYSPGSFMSPVDIGASFHWGGYVTLQTDTSVPFGIDLGARQTYDAVFGHEVVPIVQPFFKLGGSKIGIDLGPMLKEATRKQRGGSEGGFNPIPQPIKAVPQVAPRR